MKKTTETWPFVMTAKSPIIHGSDEKAGNMSFIRTIAIVGEDGQTYEVPAITGNSIRGQLRRIAARHVLDRLEVKTLPMSLYHLFFSGGSIEKGSTKIAFGVEDIKDLRTMFPYLGLFGGAYQNDVFPSTLRCEWIWPVCRETSGITGLEDKKSARELIGTVFYTRRDDKYEAIKIEDVQKSSQMIYETECLLAGIRLVGAVGVERATDLEVGCLAAAMAEWGLSPHLGGKRAIGHGKVKIENELDIPGADEYFAYLLDNKEKLVDFLTKHGANQVKAVVEAKDDNIQAS